MKSEKGHAQLPSGVIVFGAESKQGGLMPWNPSGEDSCRSSAFREILCQQDTSSANSGCALCSGGGVPASRCTVVDRSEQLVLEIIESTNVARNVSSHISEGE